MEKIRCSNCYGSQKMLKPGCFLGKCSCCEDGYNYPELKVDVVRTEKIDKRSKAYRDAICRMEEKGMNREAAIKSFEAAENNLSLN